MLIFDGQCLYYSRVRRGWSEFGRASVIRVETPRKRGFGFLVTGQSDQPFAPITPAIAFATTATLPWFRPATHMRPERTR